MKSFKKENKNSTTQAIIKNTEPIFCDFGKSKTVLLLFCCVRILCSSALILYDLKTTGASCIKFFQANRRQHRMYS